MRKLFYDLNNRPLARLIVAYQDNTKVKLSKPTKTYIELPDEVDYVEFKSFFNSSQKLQLNGTRDYIISSSYNAKPSLIFAAVYIIALLLIVVLAPSNLIFLLLLVLIIINIVLANEFKLIKNEFEIRPITNRERRDLEK